MKSEDDILDESTKDEKSRSIDLLIIIAIGSILIFGLFINIIKGFNSNEINTEVVKGTVIELDYSDVLHGDSDFEVKESIVVQYKYKDKTYISNLVCSEKLGVGDTVDLQLTINKDDTVDLLKTTLILNNEIKKGA